MKKIYAFLAVCLLSISTVSAAEMYAVFYENQHTLEYRYDNYRSYYPSAYDVPLVEEIVTNSLLNGVETIEVHESFYDAPLTSAMEGLFCIPGSLGGFYTFSNVTEIVGLEYINTATMTDLSNLFFGMKSLKTIDVNCLDMSTVEWANGMFEKCESLTTIYCNSDWREINPGIVGGTTFTECYSLVGEKGTTYSNSLWSVLYARPDGGDEKPGFFTHTANYQDLCRVTSSGEIPFTRSEVITYPTDDMARFFFYTRDDWWFDRASGSIKGESDGMALALLLFTESLSDMVGDYAFSTEGSHGTLAYLFSSMEGRIEGEYQKFMLGPGSVATISLGEEENTFDLEYSITIQEDGNETDPVTGVIYGICADMFPQGVESVPHSAVRAQKVVRDGQLMIIMPDGKTFNAFGTEIR